MIREDRARFDETGANAELWKSMLVAVEKAVYRSACEGARKTAGRPTWPQVSKEKSPRLTSG